MAVTANLCGWEGCGHIVPPGSATLWGDSGRIWKAFGWIWRRFGMGFGGELGASYKGLL